MLGLTECSRLWFNSQYFKKKKMKCKLNKSMMYLKVLEKQEYTKPEISRRKEINETETKRIIQRNETKSWYL
jgi:hypothetical protein